MTGLLRHLTQHPEASTCPVFYGHRACAWQLDIDAHGHQAQLHRIDATRPVPVCHRTSGVQPALAADHLGYVLGWRGNTFSRSRADKYHTAFIALLQQWADSTEGTADAAVAARFFTHGSQDVAPPEHTGHPRDLALITVNGRPLVDTTAAQRYWYRTVLGYKGRGTTGVCLVCGHTGPLLASMPSTLPAGQIPGATNPVSLLSDLDTAPVCADCADRAMAGLTATWRGQQHLIPSGQDVYHCWWADPPTEHDWIGRVLTGPPIDQQEREALRAAHRSCDPTARAYSLLLSANGSRAVVRQVVDRSLADILATLIAWTDRGAVADAHDTTITPTATALVAALGVWDSQQQRYRPGRTPAHAYRQLVTALLDGRGLPASLTPTLRQALRRDGHSSPARASLLAHAGLDAPTPQPAAPTAHTSLSPGAGGRAEAAQGAS